MDKNLEQEEAARLPEDFLQEGRPLAEESEGLEHREPPALVLEEPCWEILLAKVLLKKSYLLTVVPGLAAQISRELAMIIFELVVEKLSLFKIHFLDSPHQAPSSMMPERPALAGVHLP